MKTLFPLSMMAIAFLLLSCSGAKKEESSSPMYTESWESLSKHNEEPEWFKDAKLGIYFHWGVYSVPAFGNEWYPRNMHFLDSKEGQHHLETYGHPSQFGYHDFVPMFKAEHFDANKWAELFKKAGARFAGPVAEHHDGYSMWDSEVTPWNAMDTGPKRDITGELADALRQRDIKLITTFHHAKQLQRFDSLPDNGQGQGYRNSHYPFFKGMPTRSNDPDLRMLYGNIPEEEWLEKVWFGKLNEVMDKYQPDIIWFDSWLDQIPEAYRQKFCATYLNKAQEWDKEVVIVRKQDDLPLDVSVDDLEKSRKNRLEEKAWMTDETVSTGSWCYTQNLKIKPSADVLHVLIDIVSKNGVLLLNISPKSDGTIPEDQQKVLMDMGAWLEMYGESIYETRPWYTYGEGPTKEPEGHFENHSEFLKIKYSVADVRYTTSKDGKTIYATLLGVPDSIATLTMMSFAESEIGRPLEIKSVSMLGNPEALTWEIGDKGLSITTPSTMKDSNMAVVFKIETAG